ncbi:MAG TPA: DNA repair protein RadA [Candidatus Methylomirabilis sp.]|jgi:DNA repair protein RadA/Sms
MATGKARTVHTCQQCGHQEPRWLGRCPDCGAWGSLLVEQVVPAPRRGGRTAEGTAGGAAVPITEVVAAAVDRFITGLGEFDRVLGGGLVPASLVLVGGEPGVGKSTLVLQTCAGLCVRGARVLYVSGEESLEQLRRRGERIGGLTERLYLAAETSLEAAAAQVERVKPAVLVVDSVQAVASDDLDAPPGTLSQVRAVADRLRHIAKVQGIATLLIGHVTKEGTLAGPKALEHLVDAVIAFEGDPHGRYRILRATKNRFGSTDEIGVFQMAGEGLREVPNPSAAFLAERPASTPGSAVTASLEGSRPILVEVQALVGGSGAAMPRRVAAGLEGQRVAMLLAVLEKRLGLPLATCDVFLNVAGGLRVSEPAADLGVVAAVLSTYRDRPLDPGCVVFGEVGLTGEIRGVPQADRRLQEAARLGFTAALVPPSATNLAPRHLLARPVASVQELPAVLFPPPDGRAAGRRVPE